jgi:hypothetical protein
MRNRKTVLAGAAVVGVAVAAVAIGSVFGRAQVRFEERAGVRALPIDTKVDFCTTEERLAVLALDSGGSFWDAFPNQPESPEIADANQPLAAVVYAGAWPGPLLTRPGSEERKPLPGTVDVCIATLNGDDALSGGPYAVYADVPLEGSVITR